MNNPKVTKVLKFIIGLLVLQDLRRNSRVCFLPGWVYAIGSYNPRFLLAFAANDFSLAFLCPEGVINHAPTFCASCGWCASSSYYPCLTARAACADLLKTGFRVAPAIASLPGMPLTIGPQRASDPSISFRRRRADPGRHRHSPAAPTNR
jgi:hypothetical protein